MKTAKINDCIIFVGEYKNANRFKLKLSKLIKENFPEPYNASNIKEILNFALDHYSKEFERICHKKTSYKFYKLMLWLHEQSVELRKDEKVQPELEQLGSNDYFSVYRRVLKLILEEACLIDLVSKKANPNFKTETEKTFDDLMFLGDELLTLATLLAEQEMIGDAIKIQFNKAGIYQLGRNHFFDVSFDNIVDMNKYSPTSFVTDKTGLPDFLKAIKDSFDVDFESVVGLIVELYEGRKLEKWDVFSIGITEIEEILFKYDNVPKEKTEALLAGLYLSRKQKIPIRTLIRKPYEIDRFLNRPILIWKVEGKEYCVLGQLSFSESIDSLMYNAFPWGKAPAEWKSNPAFKRFLNKKAKALEGMLLDALKTEIKTVDVLHQLTIKNLITNAGIINIENEQCGEIDGIVINLLTKKIFIVEAKHLMGRYDMANFYMDFQKFTRPDGFNTKIEKKIKWVTTNLNLVEEHFCKENGLTTSIKDFKVEGIFVINTPTFYMYYSPYRIYTFHDIAKVLTSEYTDKMFTLIIEEDEGTRVVMAKYPYFKKKYFLEIPADPYEDYPVDKYGYPIIPEGEEPKK